MVGGRRTSGGGRGGWSGPNPKKKKAKEPGTKKNFSKRPGAHVFRLFLDPAHRGFWRVILERLGNHFIAKRIILIHAHDGDFSESLLLAGFHEVVIHFSAAEQHKSCFRRVLAFVGEDPLHA